MSAKQALPWGQNWRNQGNDGVEQVNGKFQKENRWEVYVQDFGWWQVYYFSNVTFSSVVRPKPAPLRRWWILQSVCLEGCSIAFVSKKILTFGFWRAVFEKRKLQSSQWLPSRGDDGRRTVKGRVRYLANSLCFHTKLTRVYSLFMPFSPPCKHSCKLAFDYFFIMSTIKKIWLWVSEGAPLNHTKAFSISPTFILSVLPHSTHPHRTSAWHWNVLSNSVKWIMWYLKLCSLPPVSNKDHIK